MDKAIEIWRDIAGFEGKYAVSNMGNVKSYPKTVKYKDGRTYKYPSKILKLYAQNGKYPRVNLFKSTGDSITQEVHRLVAETFFEKPDEGLQVNHKNGNKRDNRLTNLEWVTPGENIRHGFRTGLYSYDKLHETTILSSRIKKSKMTLSNNEYFAHPFVSNSKLSELKNTLTSSEMPNPDQAYRFGSLIDAMITEPEKVDFLRFTHGDEKFSEDEFNQAKLMKRAFMKDELCSKIIVGSEFQKVMLVKDMLFDYDIRFRLDVKCKWDIFLPAYNWGADIKSTVATTQKQFEEAARYFDYDRQRYFYMSIAGSKQDILIGISKENFKVFKLPIRHGDDFWKSGKEKCNELAFKWFLMFGDLEKISA